ncbi:MAG: ABC transporter permease [Planctomycetia bacterium]|nr:ABC transporter permease [Planctomycetia bacterium]
MHDAAPRQPVETDENWSSTPNRAAPRAPLFVAALWRRAMSDSFWMLCGCIAIMFVFHWLYVYMTSLVSSSSFINLFEGLPKTMHGLLGISFSEAATPRGRIALAYVDPTPVVITAVWALSRASDAVSGPLDRGTLEMTLAQPIRRMSVLAANAGVTIFGAALIALSAWLGTCIGVLTVSVQQTTMLIPMKVPLAGLVSCREYVPSALNLFCLTVFAAGITTLISACDRYRWRTLGIAGGFYAVEILLKMLGLAFSQLKWLFYFTFLGSYWPQSMALAGRRAWLMSLQYDGILLGSAAVCYVFAALVFARRDLPAPL